MKKLFILILFSILLIGSVSAVVRTVTTDSGWSSEGSTVSQGIQIQTNAYSLFVQNFTKTSGVTATFGQIRHNNYTILRNVTFSGNLASFTEATLNANTFYYLTYNSGGSTYTSNHKAEVTPVNLVDANMTARDAGDGTFNQTGFTGGIINIGMSNVTLVIPGNISVALDFPLNNSNITLNQLFNVTITPNDFNLTNTTFNTWFTNGTRYINTSKILSGNSPNLTSFNITFSSFMDGLLWNVLANQGNGNGSNTSYATNNFTFNTKKVVEINQTYNNPELAGASSQFRSIFDFSLGYVPLIPSLIYNGTSYQGTFSQLGNRYTFSRIITVPFTTSPQNVSFNWNTTINDSTFFTSTTNNQTLNNFSIDNCGTYTNTIFNFTMYDEENQAHMGNTTIDYAINVYNLNRDTLFLSYNKTSTSNPSRICISATLNTFSNYSLDATLKYKGNDSYAIRYYNIRNFTLTNSTTPRNISLYNINVSNSLPFLLTFRDSTSALASGVLVNVNKQYLSTNDFKTVEIPITDTNGQTILNLVRNNAIYNLIMIDSSGTIIASFNNIIAFCQDYTIGSCSIELTAPSSQQTSYNYNNDVGISYTISYSNSTKIISLSFNSINSSAQTVRMFVTTENQFGNQTVCDTSLTTTSGTLSCNIQSSTQQYFFVNVYSNGAYIGTQIINANPHFNSTGGKFGSDGFFIALLLLLTITLLFADDKQVLIIMLGVGWITVISLGLIKGAIIGLTSGGIWMVITILIFLWKLKKEENG